MMIPKRKYQPAARSPYIMPSCAHCQSENLRQISGSLAKGTPYFQCNDCGKTTKGEKLKVEDVLGDWVPPEVAT